MIGQLLKKGFDWIEIKVFWNISDRLWMIFEYISADSQHKVLKNRLGQCIYWKVIFRKLEQFILPDVYENSC